MARLLTPASFKFKFRVPVAGGVRVTLAAPGPGPEVRRCEIAMDSPADASPKGQPVDFSNPNHVKPKGTLKKSALLDLLLAHCN